MTRTEAAVREKSILFSAPMVRSILADQKTVTRRIVKPQPEDTKARGHHVIRVANYFTGAPELGQSYYWMGYGCWNSSEPFKCPYEVGMHLWVREGLYLWALGELLYRADDQPVIVAKEDETAMLAWAHRKKQNYCPSMFMPRLASRITLEVTDVRAERLQDITEGDAKAEGVADVRAFQALWESLHGKDSWALNPWVWRIAFRRIGDAR